MEPLIAIREVDHFYGSVQLRKQILHGVSANIERGEIVIITGPSGSGKTTLLTLVGALRSVQEGSLRVLGRELRGATPEMRAAIRQDIGFIFQRHNLLDALTARQNVQMSLGLDSTVSRDEAVRKSTYMLHAVALGDKLNHLPSQLSGGQMQRVAIARALVRRPSIVLADEPTASLDKTAGREIVDLLHQLAKMQGCAILIVTHDNRILDVADRLLTLEDGYLSDCSPTPTLRTGNLVADFAQCEKGLVEHLENLSWPGFVDLLDKINAE